MSSEGSGAGLRGWLACWLAGWLELGGVGPSLRPATVQGLILRAFGFSKQFNKLNLRVY